MTDHRQIYRHQAARYELLVSREDYQENILPVLSETIPIFSLTVAEFGAGTGRLTCLLAPVVRYIYAFDKSAHMLSVAARKLLHCGDRNWSLTVGDHRFMAMESGKVDVAIAGWSMCYVVVDHPENWQEELRRAMSEFRRVVKPGGYLVLLETLGTGCETPEPPPHLHDYYRWLELEGYYRSWIRTDYKFQSRAEAEYAAGFFFGSEVLPKIKEDASGIILPECTGIWWKQKVDYASHG